jgi:hypothetical protein
VKLRADPHRTTAARSSESQLLRRGLLILLVLSFATVTACTSGGDVRLSEPKLLVGRSDDVRVDARVTDQLKPGEMVEIRWELANHRQQPIAFAEVAPRAVYDPAEGMITIELGSGLPPDVPARLVRIASGERRSFSASVRMPRPALLPPKVRCDDSAPSGPQPPRLLRVDVQFLHELPESGPLTATDQLLAPDTSDQLFHLWVEKTAGVTTNAVPVYWGNLRSSAEEARARRVECNSLFP